MPVSVNNLAHTYSSDDLPLELQQVSELNGCAVRAGAVLTDRGYGTSPNIATLPIELPVKGEQKQLASNKKKKSKTKMNHTHKTEQTRTVVWVARSCTLLPTRNPIFSIGFICNIRKNSTVFELGFLLYLNHHLKVNEETNTMWKGCFHIS